jgi:hypothetical protein
MIYFNKKTLAQRVRLRFHPGGEILVVQKAME